MTCTRWQRAAAAAIVAATGITFAVAVAIRGVRQSARERGRR